MIDEERRQWPSRPKSINLVYFAVYSQSGDLKQQGMGRTLNISSGGILLETYERILDDGSIFISLGLKNDMVEVEAEIAHSSADKNGNYNTGLSFLVSENGVKDKISEYIVLFNETERK